MIFQIDLFWGTMQAEAKKHVLLLDEIVSFYLLQWNYSSSNFILNTHSMYNVWSIKTKPVQIQSKSGEFKSGIMSSSLMAKLSSLLVWESSSSSFMFGSKMPISFPKLSIPCFNSTIPAITSKIWELKVNNFCCSSMAKSRIRNKVKTVYCNFPLYLLFDYRRKWWLSFVSFLLHGEALTLQYLQFSSQTRALFFVWNKKVLQNQEGTF